MSDYSYNYNMRQFSKAQREYDAQLPPDDIECTRDCDQCGEEYECEYDDDGDLDSKICKACIEKNEEGPQT